MTNSRPVHLLLATVAIAASATTATAAPALLALAAPACPQVHVFGARETTLPPGFGSSQTLVDLLLRAFPGSTAEAIDYPAAGDDAYASSVTAGVAAVVRQATRFADACPETILIMHGYSQGGQIMDDAFCGGPDGTSLNSTGGLMPERVARNVAAIILMGDPRHVAGLFFNVGNATAPGFAARPLGFRCPQFESRMQSYCDSPDPYCANGTSPEYHQSYGRRYGTQALAFIVRKLLVGL